MKRKIFGLMIVFMLTLLLYSPLAAQQKLSIGDQAPALTGVTWLKGTHVPTFKKGRVYIVEFGTTGCAPCRSAIPHFSLLAKKYEAHATLVSVYVLGNGGHPPKDTTNVTYISKVERLVERMRDNIEYTVAVDGPAQTAYSNWMVASGQNGFPIAFVVNQHGSIVWSGSALENLDEITRQVIEGKFNPDKDINLSQGVSATFNKAWRAMKQGDCVKAIASMDSLANKKNDTPFVHETRFKILLNCDKAAAYREGWALLRNQCRDSEPALYYMARDIMDNAALDKSPDLDLVAALTERALLLSKYEAVSARILIEQARAYAAKKDFTKAISTEKRAMAFLDTYEFDDDEIRETRKMITQLMGIHQRQLSP